MDAKSFYAKYITLTGKAKAQFFHENMDALMAYGESLPKEDQANPPTARALAFAANGQRLYAEYITLKGKAKARFFHENMDDLMAYGDSLPKE